MTWNWWDCLPLVICLSLIPGDSFIESLYVKFNSIQMCIQVIQLGNGQEIMKDYANNHIFVQISLTIISILLILIGRNWLG